MTAFKNRLVKSEDLTGEEYHSLPDSFSSSQLKDMLEDPEVFYGKYIIKTIERKHIPAFDVGTYFHCAVLEPHLLEKETAVFTGAVRRGAAWEAFQEANKGKAIVSEKEKELILKMVDGVKSSPIGTKYLTDIIPEISAFLEVFVLGDEIFAFRTNDKGEEVAFSMSPVGWVQSDQGFDIEDIKEFGQRIVLKVRSDALSEKGDFISDLKSTSGNVKNAREMAAKAYELNYDLSAALYLDVFSFVSERDYNRFIWIFSDKGTCFSKSYVASEKNILVGRAKWTKAVKLIAKYKANNWEFIDELDELNPPTYANEWLN